MTRDFVLGNGEILVGLDAHARVRDLYYPYVGQENHINGQIHHIGIWINGYFSWLSSDEWTKSLAYQKDTLVTNIVITNAHQGVTLTFNDAVLHDQNVLLRNIKVQNLTDGKKEIRLFFHQQFEVSEGNVGDTVYYNPIVKSVIHYKGKRYFLMNGCVGSQGISQYATGLVGEYGREGTYKDAEDGVLGNNPIEHGSVDSTIAFEFTLNPNSTEAVSYWVCIGDCFSTVRALNGHILKNKPEKLLQATRQHWKKWVERTKFKYPDLSKNVVNLFKKSLLIINTHVDRRGSIIASSDSDMLHLRKDTYSYMWPRDGALVARSLDRAGYSEITAHFFNFCSKVITEEGYLFHKYRPDGSLGSSWHSWLKHGHIQLPIQEDELALVLDALWKHFLQHGNKEKIQAIHAPFIRKIADFMLNFMDHKTGLPHETYDLWEEKLGIHTFTCSTVYAGFQAAANFEKVFGTSVKEKAYRNAAEKVKKAILKYLYDDQNKYFIKMVYYDGDELKTDPVHDISSAYGVFQFGVLDATDERITNSVNAWKEKLLCHTNSGGYARYENDNYYRLEQNTPGNPWFITTLWLAEYYISIANTKEDLQPARDIFEWVASHTLPSGVLSEQLHPHTGAPVSVAPLTWSHAGFVIAINKYLVKLDNLGVCKMCNPPKIEHI
jgi:oligosaccharide amylase